MVTFTVFKGSKNGNITQATTIREIRPDEVLIKVTHSGVCGTDEHRRHQDMVLGHEGAGIIQETGNHVTTLAIGDHVGWGYFHSTCGECKPCLRGKENLCHDAQRYGRSNLDQGSFATHAIWKAAFVFKIPGILELEYAAPLMCGGATVFHILQSFNIKATDRIGVVGIGGLGHLAIQFAAKMGCEVVAFSSTNSKKAEAMALGATHFVATGSVKELEIGKPLDHLIVTTSSQPNWSQFFPIMADQGTIYPVTVSDEDLRLPSEEITDKELRIQGSLVAPRQVSRDMLDFAALHGIRPTIEKYPLTADGITEAMEKLRTGKMRYRAVLVAL